MLKKGTTKLQKNSAHVSYWLLSLSPKNVFTSESLLLLRDKLSLGLFQRLSAKEVVDLAVMKLMKHDGFDVFFILLQGVQPSKMAIMPIKRSQCQRSCNGVQPSKMAIMPILFQG